MLNKVLSRKLMIAAIAAQLLVLVYMAATREMIFHTGQQIYLRTAPIDPRDPFRGDFVRLCYDINTVHENKFQGETPADIFKEGDVFYTVLKPGPNDIFQVDYLSEDKPSDKVFIKGRLTRRWQFNCSNSFSHTFNLKYGIEQYFVQQGKGKEMEARLGDRNSIQIPLEMLVALGNDGTAVIKDYRWSELGVQLEFLRDAAARRSESDPVVSPLIKFTIENFSKSTIKLANPGDNCAFSLMYLNSDDYRDQADPGCSNNHNNNQEHTELIALEPGEQYSALMDFSDPRWHIEFEGKRVETGALTLRGWQQYRLRYQAPAIEGAWQGHLDSPRFTASGRID